MTWGLSTGRNLGILENITDNFGIFNVSQNLLSYIDIDIFNCAGCQIVVKGLGVICFEGV